MVKTLTIISPAHNSNVSYFDHSRHHFSALHVSSIEIVFNLDILGSVDDNLTRPPKVIEGFKPHKNLTKYCRLCYIQMKHSELLFQMFSLLKMKYLQSKLSLNLLYITSAW